MGYKFYGRGNPRLEAFKFSLYVAIPIAASFVFSKPQYMDKVIKALSLVEYPPEDNESVLAATSVHEPDQQIGRR